MVIAIDSEKRTVAGGKTVTTHFLRRSIDKSKKANPEGLAFLLFTGAGERSRTPDLRITNALLYQLSYTG